MMLNINKIVLLMIYTILITAKAYAETTECMTINSIPVVINQSGVYCFKAHHSINISTGYAIEIQEDNVTIDFNGFKLDATSAGIGTDALGVFAVDRNNITIRNGNIRGFYYGIFLQSTFFTNPGHHLVTDNRLENNTFMGMNIQGSANIVQGNHVSTTGGSSFKDQAYGILVAGPAARILENTIDKVDSKGTSGIAYGIRLSEGNAGIIKDNNITRIENPGGSALSVGISLNSTNYVVIDSNSIVNDESDFTGEGIRGVEKENTACRNNRIVNYSEQDLIVCNDSGGNIFF